MRVKNLIIEVPSLVLISAAFFVMAACGSSGAERVSSVLDEAEQSVAEGDYARGLELCREVTQGEDTLNLTWKDYCRAAVVYAAGYDHDVDTEASMASAARCIEKARRLNADSAKVFFNGLSPQMSAQVNTVIQTLDALNTDHSNLPDHEEDEIHDDHDHPEEGENQ